MGNRVVVLALLCAGIVTTWFKNATFTPGVTNDGVQYLDAAAHVRAGRGLCTDLAHFDEQVDYGRFPVPFTHFAPGYPLIVAGVSRLGMSLLSAAGLISVLSYLAIIWLMWEIGTLLGAEPWAVALFACLWIGHPAAVEYASKVGTDLPFTALFLAVAAFIIRDLRSKGVQPALLFCIGLSAASTYWMRSVGIFVLPLALLYILWRGWSTRATRLWAASAFVSTCVAAAIVPIRNLHFTGSWQGGFGAGHGHSLRFVIVESVKAYYHIVFGEGVVARFDIWMAMAIAALGTFAFLTLRAWRRRSPDVPDHLPAAVFWISLQVALYGGGVAIAGLRTIASDFARYNIPLYPLILAAIAGFCLIRQRYHYAAAALLVICVTAITGRTLLMPGSFNGTTASIDAMWNQQTNAGVTVGKWLQRNVHPEDTIVAVKGQMLYYYVQRRVIAIINPDYSSRKQDEIALRQLMKIRHARFLVVMPNTPADEIPEQESIPFLRELAAGAVPGWLTPSARSSQVAVFTCPDCL